MIQGLRSTEYDHTDSVPCDMDDPELETVFENGAEDNHGHLADIQDNAEEDLEPTRDEESDSFDGDISDTFSDIVPLQEDDFIMGMQSGMLSTMCPQTDSLEMSFGNMSLGDENPHHSSFQISNAFHEAQLVLGDLDGSQITSVGGMSEAGGIICHSDYDDPPESSLVLSASEHVVTEQQVDDQAGNASTVMEVPISSTVYGPRSRKEILTTQSSAPVNFGIRQTRAPAEIFYKHMTEIGKDDDIAKILLDLQEKLSAGEDNSNTYDTILFGGDHKLANNLYKLQSKSQNFSQFLPIPPVLRLRKSRINTLYSAYEDAGIIQILQVMRNDVRHDWPALAGKDHTDMATTNVRRIGIAIQMALLLLFSQSLPEKQSEEFMSQLHSGLNVEMAEKWNEEYCNFISEKKSKNATFELHCDILKHCNVIIALKLAERMGGEAGFQLLLAAMKESLGWSFLNGAICYGPFCTDLLYSYMCASSYHKNLVHLLWSSPIKNGQVNHGPDTKRELFHQDATPGIRTARSEKAVTTRLARMDHYSQIHDIQVSARKGHSTTHLEGDDALSDRLSWQLTESDILHIHRGASLVVKQMKKFNVCSEISNQPSNIYNKDRHQGSALIPLGRSILDSVTLPGVGKYLIQKYAVDRKMFGLCEQDKMNADDVTGPSDLVKKVLKNKSFTTRRIKCKTSVEKSQEQKDQEIYQKTLSKDMKTLQALSSKMNTCQALVNKDCSKRTIRKAVGISNALSKLETICGNRSSETSTVGQIQLGVSHIPENLRESIRHASLEFAGVKFKVDATSGQEFLIKSSQVGIEPILRELPNLETLVICEEKYSFTPDVLKGPTRQARQATTSNSSIAHLLADSQILSEDSFDQAAVRQTMKGKQLASTYLAQNIEQLTIKKDISLIIDSEQKIVECPCEKNNCTCLGKYSVPMHCTFSKIDSYVADSKYYMPIRQRKGEGEMAVMDWLLWFTTDGSLGENESTAAIISSGDIDAVVICLFMVARLWPRYDNGKFKNNVFIILQKPHHLFDIYCISGLLEAMEVAFNTDKIGQVVAVALCIGGNDFLTGFRHKSHTKILTTVLSYDMLYQNLLANEATVSLRRDVFVLLVKHLYAVKGQDPVATPYETIRQATIRAKKNISPTALGIAVSDPGTWLPPQSAIERLAELADMQVMYLMTVGSHSEPLPYFENCGCMTTLPCGNITFNFGEDSHVVNVETLMTSNEPVGAEVSSRNKRSHTTPQKRRKRIPKQSTPKGLNKRV